MPVHYALRVQFGPHVDAATGVAELLEACRGAHASEVLLFLAAEELNNGHETLEELREWLAVLRPYRDALVREGPAGQPEPVDYRAALRPLAAAEAGAGLADDG
jgi:hypothetical protein